MFKSLKKKILFAILVIIVSCSKEEVNLPEKMDSIIGSWSPIVGLMTGEIIDGDYGKESFKYSFGECAKEKGHITFKDDGSLDFINYLGNFNNGCKIIEKAKDVYWESEGDSTYVASGIISQINNDGTYKEKDIDFILSEPYFVYPDLVEVKNDTLIMYFDKIPNTKLYFSRFFYEKKH
jgi:hypothetical protein